MRSIALRLVMFSLGLLGCEGSVTSTGSDGGSLGVDGGGSIGVDAGGSMSVDARVERPDARAGEGGAPPPGTGWSELPGTRIDSVCSDREDVHGVVGCAAVILAWGGGIADLASQRMIVWGGGHNDYYGNEVYAVDIDEGVVLRLTDPSPPNPTPDDCGVTTLPDGRPNSRHTYGNLAYIAHAGSMFAWGGATSCRPGGGTNDTWTLDLTSLEWTRRDPTSGDGPPAAFIAATDYDAANRRVLVHNTSTLYAYDSDTNTYTLLRDSVGTDYHMTGVFLADRQLFVLVGGGEHHVFDTSAGSDYAMSSPALSGCDALRDAAYPGLAYDPVERKVVGWAGGDDVYLLDPDTRACEVRPFPGGPGPAQANGTNGRFRYFPALDAYALVNAIDQNAYVLRLRPAP